MPIIKRILLVDDNEADNVYHEIVLRRAGFDGRVDVCESGQAALDYLQRSAQWPELILIDINMPGMDGFAFVTAAAPMLQGCAIALVMLTSSGAVQDRQRAQALTTISGYLVKPLTAAMARQLLQPPFTVVAGDTCN